MLRFGRDIVKDVPVPHPLPEGLQREFLNPQYSDVLITVEDRKFKGHKVILAAISGFFEHYFLSTMNKGKTTTMEVEGITADIFAMVLDWIYTGEMKIKDENVPELLAAADLFEIEDLREYINKFVEKQRHFYEVVGRYIS